MKRTTPLARYVIFSLFALTLPLVSRAAADAPDLLKVTNIKFDDCFRKADESWFQMEIELVGDKNPDTKALNQDYLTNVKIEATLAYENPNPEAKNRFVFFRAKQTIAALKASTRRKIYFFMPGDVINMLKLANRPPYAFLRFEVNGKELMPNKTHLYGGLQPKMLDDFKKMADAEVKQTEGMFLPLTEAPWYVMDQVEFKVLPSFVRGVERF